MVREERGPSGGVVHLRSSAPEASPGFLQQWTALASWEEFTTAGCPLTCGNETCYHDESCLVEPPRLGGYGCNAGGFGQQCRACGFGAYEPCPDNATLASSPELGGSDQVKTLASALAYEVCVGTTPFGCQVLPLAPVHVPRTTTEYTSHRHHHSQSEWRRPLAPSLRGGAASSAPVEWNRTSDSSSTYHWRVRASSDS